MFAHIKWIDTVDSSGWDTPDKVSVIEVDQWGFIVHEDELQVKIADTWSEGSFFGVTAIPRGCVREINHLASVEDPA